MWRHRGAHSIFRLRVLIMRRAEHEPRCIRHRGQFEGGNVLTTGENPQLKLSHICCDNIVLSKDLAVFGFSLSLPFVVILTPAQVTKFS